MMVEHSDDPIHCKANERNLHYEPADAGHAVSYQVYGVKEAIDAGHHGSLQCWRHPVPATYIETVGGDKHMDSEPD